MSLPISSVACHRGKGVGRALLRAMHEQAGVARVSLSVERANPAQRLYLSEGYRVVDQAKDSDTMLVDLR